MNITKLKLSELNPAVYNPRKNLTPDDEEYKHIKQSILDFGYIDPIIVNIRNQVIVGGHQRYKILLELGYTEADCVIVDMDETEEKACNLALNKAQGDWDEDALRELLKELDEFGKDMEQYGFDTSEILDEDGEVIDDGYNPEEILEQEPIAQRGDIYQLGNHRLMCGDSTNQEDVRKLLDGNLVKLICTDPPYNVDYTGKSKKRERIENDSMEDSMFYEFLLDALSNAYQSAEDGAAIYVWHADTESLNFRNAFIQSGFDLKQCLVWVKNTVVFGRQDYHWKHEPCLYGWKSGAAHYFTSDRTNTTVYDDTKQINAKKMKKDALIELVERLLTEKQEEAHTVLYCDKPSSSMEHPTMKPMKLIGELVKNSSQKGWNVLDLFGGSGTTLMVCEALERNAYLMEYEPKYIDVIIDRWQKATGKEAVLLYRGEQNESLQSA